MILEDRETELRKIYRYRGFSEDMFFRPNLEIHTKRVVLMAEYICKILQKQGVRVDIKYIKTLASMHDDDEFITWDFVSGRKLNFSPEEKQEYEQNCKNAIDILVENYGDEYMWHSYRDLLEDNNTWASLEYKIVDLADKLDAHGEVCHEIYNGNKEFLKENIHPHHWAIPVYDFTYIRVTGRIKQLEEVTWARIDLMKERIDSQDIFWKFRVASREDIWKIQAAYEIYDTWIQLQRDNFSQGDLEKLYIRSNGST